MSVKVAESIADAFVSPNVPDSNMEPANVVDVIAGAGLNISRAIHRLGTNDAGTSMGAIEAHAKAILDSSERIAGSIDNLAEAIRESRLEP